MAQSALSVQPQAEQARLSAEAAASSRVATARAAEMSVNMEGSSVGAAPGVRRRAASVQNGRRQSTRRSGRFRPDGWPARGGRARLRDACAHGGGRERRRRRESEDGDRGAAAPGRTGVVCASVQKAQASLRCARAASCGVPDGVDWQMAAQSARPLGLRQPRERGHQRRGQQRDERQLHAQASQEGGRSEEGSGCTGRV